MHDNDEFSPGMHSKGEEGRGGRLARLVRAGITYNVENMHSHFQILLYISHKNHLMCHFTHREKMILRVNIKITWPKNALD